MSDRPALELIVLCGALGSGKTTLLERFLGQRDLRDTAVIVNEAGALGIDAAVLQAASPTDPVLLLDNGCVCCSLRSTLVQTLLDLLHQPRPDGYPPLARVVIETSGISRPGPLLASLRDRDLVHFSPQIRVVCTLDATRLPATSESAAAELTDLLAQWAAAHRIVVTRTDLASAMPLASAASQAHGLNPLAEVVAEPDVQQRCLQAFAHAGQPFASYRPEADAAWRFLPASAHPRLIVLQGQPACGMTWDRFAAWVDDLAGLLGERLLRFKAIVALADRTEPMMLQGVGTTFGRPVRAAAVFERMGSQPSVIVIARDTDVAEIACELPDAPVALRVVQHESARPAAWQEARFRPGYADYPEAPI